MPAAGFDPTIPANKRPKNYVSDSATTGINTRLYHITEIISVYEELWKEVVVA
jgi:hypothetical protein